MSVANMRNNWYVKWVIMNHKLHHIRKGKKGNYNIVFLEQILYLVFITQNLRLLFFTYL